MSDKPDEVPDERPDEGERNSDDEPGFLRRLSARNRPLRDLGGDSVGAGLTFGVTLVVFTLLGVWLDSLFSTRPLFLLVGLALGGVGGFIHLVETISPGTLFRSRRPDRLKRRTEAQDGAAASNEQPGPREGARDDDTA